MLGHYGYAYKYYSNANETNLDIRLISSFTLIGMSHPYYSKYERKNVLVYSNRSVSSILHLTLSRQVIWIAVDSRAALPRFARP